MHTFDATHEARVKLMQSSEGRSMKLVSIHRYMLAMTARMNHSCKPRGRRYQYVRNLACEEGIEELGLGNKR